MTTITILFGKARKLTENKAMSAKATKKLGNKVKKDVDLSYSIEAMFGHFVEPYDMDKGIYCVCTGWD